MARNTQDKLAIINDFSGFGRCSLTAAIPIVSALKVQACPVPTAIFSNHTAYPSFFYEDYTEKMPLYMEEWKKLDLRFQGILIGFLGSVRQIDITADFIKHMKMEHGVVILDPIMGDNGRLYATYDEALCAAMEKLVRCADILTPNLTEACILTGTDYHEGSWSRQELQTMADRLHAMGPDKIVITGIPQGQFLANFCCEKSGQGYFLRCRKIGESRCGTGDVFSAMIGAQAVKGVPFRESVRKAIRFVKRAIEVTETMDVPKEDGVCFEEILSTLS